MSGGGRLPEQKEKPLMLEHQRAVRAGWHRKDLQMNYNTNNTNRARKALIILICAVILAGIVYRVAYGAILEAMDGQTITCWILCQPNDPKDGGHYVNARIAPSTNSEAVGYLENGYSFQTDAKNKNGFLRAYGIGENGMAWIYAGFVVTEEPEIINERYVCVSNGRVAIRRWMNGPRVAGTGWLTNGSNVYVYAIADGWAITNRGYIMAEYLEVDPE